MGFLSRIRDFIQELEEKDFYKYLVTTLIVLVVSILLMIFFYFRQIGYYEDLISEINEQRETQVRNILTRFEVVKKQRQDVAEILKQDEDFKIGDYFDKLLKSLNISKDIIKEENVVQKDLSDEYGKSELTARLDGINVRQVVEILKELESKKRIYIELLEIKRSKKKRRAIDVDLTISTLLPKT